MIPRSHHTPERLRTRRVEHHLRHARLPTGPTIDTDIPTARQEEPVPLSLRRALAAASTVAALAACAGTPVVVAQPAAVVEPATYGPTVGGRLYCGYRFIEAECWGVPGEPVLLPTYTPNVSDLLAVALWHHFLTYQPSYDGEWGYSRYERNARRTGVTVVIVKDTYISNGTRWRKDHRSDVDRYAKNAPYISRGADGKPVTVKGDKYATAANKAADLTRAKENRTSTGTAGNAGTTKTGTTATTEKNATSRTTTTTTTGKTGSSYTPPTVRRK